MVFRQSVPFISDESIFKEVKTTMRGDNSSWRRISQSLQAWLNLNLLAIVHIESGNIITIDYNLGLISKFTQMLLDHQYIVPAWFVQDLMLKL